MAPDPIRLLVLEDNPGDIRLLRELLAGVTTGTFQIDHVERLSQALERLSGNTYDLVLIDLSVPDSQGLGTFTTIHARAPHLPMVILSSLNDERFSVEAVRQGAQDYLVKGTLDSTVLARVIRYAIERNAIELLKKEFISIINHEIRTPFTSVYLALQLLMSQNRGQMNEAGQKLLTTAHDNCKLLLRLINNVLDVEKVEAGQLDLSLKPVDLVETVHEAVSFNQMYGDQYSVIFAVRTRMENAWVMADNDRLIQVLTNFLTNAAKHAPMEKPVLVSIAPCHGVIRVAVTDQGPGIPAEFHSRVFQKFAKFDAPGSHQRHKGTGLGLNICKHIIEQLGGKIGFKTKPGKATTFYFELPEYKDGIKASSK